MRRILRRLHDVEVVEADSYETGLRAIAETFDLLFVDVRLSDRDDDRGGLRLLAELRRLGRETPAIVVTGSVATDDIREAMRLGARDYLLKDELGEQTIVPMVTSFRDRLATREPPRSEQRLRRDRGAAVDDRRLVAGDGARAAPDHRVSRPRTCRSSSSARPAPARRWSRARSTMSAAPRASRLSPSTARRSRATLLESLLFGHERGAFTGAERRTPRSLRAARSADTLLLDEVGELPLELQAKLLRVLEDGRFLPGRRRAKRSPLRARVLAATNVDLGARVADGRFRSDLFYRLDVVTIRLPTARERADDIEELVSRSTTRCRGSCGTRRARSSGSRAVRGRGTCAS